MGKPTGFMEYTRVQSRYRPVDERIQDYREIALPVEEEDLRREGARCMDCGTPFCHSFGCPLINLIPEWNDLVWRKDWREAIERLHATNNFPEFTGTLCPAPCEAACVLAINNDPVTIKQVEVEIVDRAWEEGWVPPQPAQTKTGKKVAIVGSFPFVPRLRRKVGQLWVLERHPVQGEWGAEEASNIIPQADVVAITGTSLINHTFEELIKLCRPEAFVLVLGPTTPLSPVLFDYGADVISGTLITDPEKVLRYISQGASFRQIKRSKGVKLLTLARDS